MTSTVADLTWPQRLQVISKLNVSDTKASKIFGVSKKQLSTAKTEHEADHSFDHNPYQDVFADRKRGSSGTKIVNAFMNITKEPQCIATFAKENLVSTAVLRQHSRFVEKIPQGRVVHTLLHNNVKSIWYTDSEGDVSEGETPNV